MFRLFNKQYAIHSVMALVMMNLFFFGTLGDISSTGKFLFIRKSIVCAIAIYATQMLVQRSFFNRTWYGSLLFVVWWYLFAVLKYFVIDGGEIGLYEKEIFIGTYGAAAFIAVQYFCNEYVNKKAVIWGVDFFRILLCLPPVITYIHYSIYGYPIVYEEMLAVYNTNFREAIGWAITYLGLSKAVMLVSGGAALYACLHYLRIKLGRNYEKVGKPRNKYLVIAVIIALFYYPLMTLSKTDCVGFYFMAMKYSHDIKSYSQDIAEKYNSIQFVNDIQVCDSPHTIIMVIGESTGRDLMKVYNDEYLYNNTPWLNECKNNNDFIVFSNAYACQSLTQQVLQNALTEKSYYNDKKFLESMNIVDIAKKKGYKTYWITNLEGDNSASTFALVASRSDRVIYTHGEYDDAMLDGLSQINPNDNNFIIMHGNGTHAAYTERYPKERTVFMEDSRAAEYSNAVHYVDSFLRKVYSYGVDNLNMQVMVYYSDHGENLQTGHGPSDHSFDKVRIPMFLYLGREYQNKNQEKFQRVLLSKDAFYTNDMIYNTLSGIMNAESNYYNSEEDISNKEYSRRLEDLWTFGKEVKVSDDPFLR